MPQPKTTPSGAALPETSQPLIAEKPKKTASKVPFGSLKSLHAALVQGDPKAIHEVRKLSRKQGAELALADAPRKQRRAWRDIRRLAAPIRDHDITGEHIAAALERLKVPENQVRQFQAAWAKGRQQHLKGVEWPEIPELIRPKKLREKARESLPEQARHLLAEGAVMLPTHDSARWHEWRKEMKRYRYTLEVLGNPPQIVKDVLDALGRLQDAEVVMDAVASPDWPFGHAEELTRQEKRRGSGHARKLGSFGPR